MKIALLPAGSIVGHFGSHPITIHGPRWAVLDDDGNVVQHCNRYDVRAQPQVFTRKNVAQQRMKELEAR